MKITAQNGIQTDLPEYIYLITVDGEWPVGAIAADNRDLPERVEEEVTRRTKRANPPRSTTMAHVWRIPVSQASEVELIPAKTIQAQFRDI